MTVIAMKKNTLAILNYDDVTNIQITNAQYIITYNGASAAISALNRSEYTIHIMMQ